MTESEIQPDETVDARGAACPGPLMDLIGKIRSVDSGTVILLLSDNDQSLTDVPEWVAEAGNELLDVMALGESALDDEMVRSLASTGGSLGELGQTAADDVRDGLETMLEGVGAAADEPPERVGFVGLLRKSRNPDVQ